MKSIFCFAFFLITTIVVEGQDTSKKNQPIVQNLIKADPTPVDLERIPQFLGGLAMFNKYIDEHAERLLKPNHANGIVVVKATIDRQGKVASALVVRNLTAETDSAAVYLLKNGPTWQPGHDKGVAISATINVGIKFHEPGNLQVARVPAITLSNKTNAEVAIDEPVGTANSYKTQTFDPNKIYTSVEKAPEFPGGYESFIKYLKDNNSLKGTDKNINGRVIISFVVERDGSLTNIKIARGISTDCDDEALRLLKLSPKWHAGTNNGESVRVAYTIPMLFGEN